MKKTFKHIWSLYLHNPSFLILSGIFLMSALISKLLYHGGYLFYAEEVFNMLFVVSLWAAFYLGMIIKQQLASHRASLMPHYRGAHILIAAAIYLGMMAVGYFWMFAYQPVLNIAPVGLWGIYFTCILIALIITYLGYLSIARVLIYAYLVLVIFSNQAFNVIALLNNSLYLALFTAAACALFAGVFVLRLNRVKEDSFEYHHIFAWPPRRLIVNQIRASQSVSDAVSPIFRLLASPKKTYIIPRYNTKTDIFSRAYHWGHTENTDLKMIWMLILLAAPFILMLVNRQSALESFGRQVYSNFLLLSISPVLITIGANYRRIAYWGYDILKPVDRRQYMLQQGIVSMTNLLMYWALFAVCFAVLPNIFSQPEIFATKKYWAYLFLTGIFAAVVLCWLAGLSCAKSPAAVITQGLVFGLTALIGFYCVEVFSFEQLMIANAVLLALSLIFGRKAYEAWCDNEFDNP